MRLILSLPRLLALLQPNLLFTLFKICKENGDMGRLKYRFVKRHHFHVDMSLSRPLMTRAQPLSDMPTFNGVYQHNTAQMFFDALSLDNKTIDLKLLDPIPQSKTCEANVLRFWILKLVTEYSVFRSYSQEIQIAASFHTIRKNFCRIVASLQPLKEVFRNKKYQRTEAPGTIHFMLALLQNVNRWSTIPIKSFHQSFL